MFPWNPCGNRIAINNYYPFGMLQPRAYWQSDEFSHLGGHNYGFNGMEEDDDIKGPGNSLTTEFRMNDSRLGGSWWCIDPVIQPSESPYAGYGNNPVLFVDPSGNIAQFPILFVIDSPSGYEVNGEVIHMISQEPLTAIQKQTFRLIVGAITKPVGGILEIASGLYIIVETGGLATSGGCYLVGDGIVKIIDGVEDIGNLIEGPNERTGKYNEDFMPNTLVGWVVGAVVEFDTPLGEKQYSQHEAVKKADQIANTGLLVYSIPNIKNALNGLLWSISFIQESSEWFAPTEEDNITITYDQVTVTVTGNDTWEEIDKKSKYPFSEYFKKFHEKPKEGCTYHVTTKVSYNEDNGSYKLQAEGKIVNNSNNEK